MGWVSEGHGGDRRKLTSAITALLPVARLAAVAIGVGVMADPLLAVDLPPVTSPLFLQTSGPSADIGVGDWYSSPPPGGGTDHLFELNVPQLWPAGTPLTVALFDPELQIPDPVSPTAIDEIRGSGPDDASFILEAPGGTVLASVTYTPNGGTNGQWAELLTFDPGVYGPGAYLLRTTVSNDDDNSWRLAFDHDPDCAVSGTPGTCAPGSLSNGNEVDNPDASPGTGDELTIGIQRASYQHGGVGQTCKTFYFFVAPATASITLHNFDMDNNGSVTYHSPSGSSYAGTLSANARWNNSPNATRVGDTLAVGGVDEGWWSADLCISSGNQYIFEGVNGESVFLDLIPAVPEMTLAKSDGVTSVDPGETITYVLNYANTSDLTPNPGLATDVTISDTVPAATTYQTCAIDGPPTGTCSESGGVVTFTLDNPVLPGESGTVRVTVDVDGGATGSIANSAALTYSDPLGNNYSPELATDVDTVQAPIAVDDAYSTLEDTPLVVAAPGVLGNDSDPDGDPITVVSATDPPNGTVVVNPDGSMTYTPDPDWSGIDTFTYQMCDNGGIPLCDTATVTITVTPQNDPPIAVDDTNTTSEDTPVTTSVLGNDSDPDGDPLTAVSATDPPNGTVLINPDNTITYTPDPGFTGTDTFTYTISDGNGGTDMATLTIVVARSGGGGNNDPVATDDGATTDQEAPVVIDVLANDYDGDGDVLTVISTTVPANGTTMINPNGTITYTPAAGFTGTDTFTYTITDGNGGTDTATITVIVDPVNNPPVFTDDPHNTYQTVTIGGSVKALTGGDPDNDPYSYALSGGAFPPGVSLNPDGTFTGSPTTVGTFTTTITICDIHGLCSTGALTILVQAQLPRTGIDSDLLAVFGPLLILLGALMVGGSRQRRLNPTR